MEKFEAAEEQEKEEATECKEAEEAEEAESEGEAAVAAEGEGEGEEAGEEEGGGWRRSNRSRRVWSSWRSCAVYPPAPEDGSPTPTTPPRPPRPPPAAPGPPRPTALKTAWNINGVDRARNSALVWRARAGVERSRGVLVLELLLCVCLLEICCCYSPRHSFTSSDQVSRAECSWCRAHGADSDSDCSVLH